MKENIDYELIPVEEQDHWNVRIKTGEFVETVFNFGAIKVSDDGEYLNFNYDLVYSPIEGITEDSLELQEVVKEILMAILDHSLNEIQKMET